jgi:hypothetical protein
MKQSRSAIPWRSILEKRTSNRTIIRYTRRIFSKYDGHAKNEVPFDVAIMSAQMESAKIKQSVKGGRDKNLWDTHQWSNHGPVLSIPE